MPNLCDKESYDCNDLIKIVGILRSPEGCQWDRAQDHHTIRNNFLEEAYEAVEAIDLESSALLREELGDVLFAAVKVGRFAGVDPEVAKWRRSRAILILMMYAPGFAAR
jgi:uncharacterized protein YabN with tetrapyrrole methylase and pyrophosphatase domain